MNYMQRIRWATLFVAILAALTVRPAGATGASHLKCGGWTVVPSPSAYMVAGLSSVTAVSPNNVWAVGGGGDNGIATQTLIEHWNGTNWQDVSPKISAFLNSVTALSANNIWAVGSHKQIYTVIEHWNGTKWSVIHSPNGGKQLNDLESVAAVSPSDIWAVGNYGLGNYDNTLIEHWNGAKWSIIPSPSVGSSINNLTGVTAISSTDVWAVGSYYSVNNNHNFPLTEHWNGTKWSIIHAPGMGNDPNLFAVTSTDANHVWAVGYLTNQGGSLIERWNRSRWRIMSSPPNSQYVFLYGIAASSPTSIWAVGGGPSTVTMHWDGTKWRTVPSPNGPNFDNQLSGVTMVSAHSAWTVGYSADSSTGVSSTLIEYYC